MASSLALGSAAAVLGLSVRRARSRAAAALALALASGSLALALRLGSAAAGGSSASRVASVEGRVESVRPLAEGLRVDLEQVRPLQSEAAPLPRRLRVLLPPESRGELAEPGAPLRARLRITPPRALRNPGLSHDPRALARLGIGAFARLQHPALIARLAAPGGAAARIARLRRRLAERLARTGSGGALLRALALGDASGLRPATRDAFARLGISHLLAVSGLHLALVAGGAYALARRALARSATLAARCDVRDPARAAALCTATLYALLCGFGVPVRRAWVLVIAGTVCAAGARRTGAFHPLSAAALVVLAGQPEALFAPGAQLSFAACAALLWGASRERDERDERDGEGGRSHGSRLLRALGASASAVAATAPLAAWHFGSAAPLAVGVNLLAIPWTGLVLLPVALGAAVAAACSGAAGPVQLALQLVLRLAERLAALTLWTVQWLAAPLPSGPGVGPHPLVLAAAAALAVLTIRVRDPRLRALLATGLAAGLWCAPPPALRPAPPRLVVLDVGRGDAVLVQGRVGSVLVDGAPAVPGRFDRGASVVVPALRALGVRRLDLVIATHADVDHRGGLPAVLASLPVGALWLPPGARADPDFAALRSAARAGRVALQEVARDTPGRVLGDLRVTPLWPPRADIAGPRNERSLAVRIDVGRRRVLLLGDLGRAEAALLATGDDLRADVLLLPHHGSGGSGSTPLLAAVAPEVAIVSAPCPPQRGLPHPDTLQRARRVASVWWSGRDGAVLVGLADPLVAVPFAPPRDCERFRSAGAAERRQAETRSVPSNASTSGRHTKRTGGNVTSARAIEAETGW